MLARVLVVIAGEGDRLPEVIHERVAHTPAEVLVVAPATPAADRGRSQHRGRRPASAVFHADVLVVDGDLAERAHRRRFGLPIVPLRDAA
jgi:hypothetical protein